MRTNKNSGDFCFSYFHNANVLCVSVAIRRYADGVEMVEHSLHHNGRWTCQLGVTNAVIFTTGRPNK